MILCPIAYWKHQRPQALFYENLTYSEMDNLIQKVCSDLAEIPENILAFVPKYSPLDVAFFFAAWRMGKAVYPISFRIPPKGVQERIKMTQAKWIDLSTFSLQTQIDEPYLNENALATLIETSSASKIVCHRLCSHLASAKAVATAIELVSGDLYCLNLPLFHVSGIATFIRSALIGATLIPPENADQATHISMVPTQLYRLLEHPKPMPSLKCLLLGGAPVSETLYKKGLEEGYPLHISYGMTETSSMALMKPPFGQMRPLDHIESQISESGEIFLRGPSLFKNYFRKEDRAARVRAMATGRAG